MIPDDLSTQVANLLSYLMIIVALAISSSTTLKRMVRLYQGQALVLTAVVLLTSVEPGRQRLPLSVLATLPAALAVAAPALLARASLTPEPLPAGPHRAWRWLRALRGARRRADPTWLRHGRSRLPTGASATVDIALIAMAVLVAYRIVLGIGTTAGPAGRSLVNAEVVPVMAVSIALLLQGLFTMVNKTDIIAQVVGLLVIEHGLFLAAVRIAPPAMSLLFVLSLFFYVLVTLTILLWILPELHRASSSIEVSQNKRLRG